MLMLGSRTHYRVAIIVLMRPDHIDRCIISHAEGLYRSEETLRPRGSASVYDIAGGNTLKPGPEANCRFRHDIEPGY
jgi:hypothetical protein